MALVDLAGWARVGFPLGATNENFATATTTYVLDASGEIAAVIFKAPKTGSIDRVTAHVGAVGNTPDNGLRASLQNVNLTTGVNDGTPDENATIASGSVAVGLLEWTLSASRSVTINEEVAVVIDIPTFTAGDSVTITHQSTGGNSVGFPYGIAATSSKQSSAMPMLAVRYTTGEWYLLTPWFNLFSSTTTFNIDNGTTPDEVGLAFTLPWNAKLAEAQWSIAVQATTSDFDIVLYDASNTVLSTSSEEGHIVASTSARRYLTMFDHVTLTAGALYRLVIKPTTTNNVSLNYGVVPSGDLFLASQTGGVAYATARTDAGAWTNYDNGSDGYRIPYIQLWLSAVDDGAVSALTPAAGALAWTGYAPSLGFSILMPDEA
jgi:hypothetical protein